jgi:predicted ferric reductase
MTRNARHAWAGIIIFTTAILILCAISVPFKFESPSMFYKFGIDKFLLRTGKMMGLTAAMLLLYQLPLAGRLQSLDRIFSLPVLYRIHRISAYVICLLVLLHPACVLISNDMLTIPLEARYWPEWVGAGLLVLILCQAVLARWRRPFSIPYYRWLGLHRLMGIMMVAALVVHVLYVSETFEQDGIPRTVLFMAAGCWACLWIWVRVKSYWSKRHPYTVARVAGAGKDAYAIDLSLAGARPFPYAPGQFVFVSFHSMWIPDEVHPFTLSSTPSRSDALQITVRRCGDWTDRICDLREGDKAFILGPFGCFTYLTEPPDREIVMIAGGIGVTPMLSMLRHMRDRGDPRPITLIWSNRSEAYLFGRRELEKIQSQLTQFKWMPVFTRKKGSFGYFGRLDRSLLERLLEDTRRDAAVFICGPPVMMQYVHGILRQLGFPSSCIKQETFGL